MTRGGKDGAVSSKFSSSFYVDDNITKRSFLSKIVHCSKNLTWIGHVAIIEELCLPFIRHLCSVKSYVITMLPIDHVLTATARAITLVLVNICNRLNYMWTTHVSHFLGDFCNNVAASFPTAITSLTIRETTNKRMIFICTRKNWIGYLITLGTRALNGIRDCWTPWYGTKK